MSFSYDNTLATDRDKLRLLISDTSLTGVIFQNEELDGLLSMGGSNVYLAAALAIRSRAAAFVDKAIAYTVGGNTDAVIKVDRTQILQGFLRMAQTFEQYAKTIVDETFDRLDFDVDVFGDDISDYQGSVRWQ